MRKRIRIQVCQIQTAGGSDAQQEELPSEASAPVIIRTLEEEEGLEPLSRSVRPRVGPTPEESRADARPRLTSGVEPDPEAMVIPEATEGSEAGTASMVATTPAAYEVDEAHSSDEEIDSSRSSS